MNGIKKLNVKEINGFEKECLIDLRFLRVLFKYILEDNYFEGISQIFSPKNHIQLYNLCPHIAYRKN
jgi:hypothetical protein